MKKTCFVFLLLAVNQLLIAQTQIVAHRGFWNTAGAAQNSVKALQKADSIRVFASEVDVWLSSDGVPVVNHDDSVLYKGAKISVQNTNSEILRTIRLKNNEQLPTLKEYLVAFKKLKNIKLIIELKKHRTKAQEDALAEKVLKMVRKMKLEKRVEYISFGLNFTTKIIHLNPAANVYYLNGDLSPDVMKEIGAAGIDYHHSVIKKHPEWVNRAHDLGLKVNVWTLNNPDDIRQMLDLKVDFITTDNPLLVKELIP